MEAVIKVLIEIAGFTKEWGALIIAGISLLIAIISLFKRIEVKGMVNVRFRGQIYSRNYTFHSYILP